MRVALNLLGLPSLRQGGAAVYAEMLIRGLAGRDDVGLTVLCDDRVAGELGEVEAQVHSLSRRPRSRGAATADLALAARDPRRFSDGYGRVPSSLLAGCDLVHYPLSFLAPPAHSLPSVITSVDVQHRVLPEAFSVSDRMLRRVRWNRALTVADRVIAISRFTAATLERLGMAPGVPVDVVPLACDERYYDPPPAPARAGAYVLYPASPLPAKNHRRLLRAFASLSGLDLVLCGPALHDWSPVRRQVSELGLEGRVALEGTVSLERLRALYAGARGLVFPSLFEGFGLPLLEAMATGCPVAAGAAGSVPEVLGGHGRLFDPRDEGAIASAIVGLAELTSSERESAAAGGRARAEAFRPEAMVEGTVAAYRRALSA